VNNSRASVAPGRMGMSTPPLDVRSAIARAAPMLRLPTSPDRPPEVLTGGNGLRCSVSGRVYPYRGGVLNLLAEEPGLTTAQHLWNVPVAAWAYDRFREILYALVGALGFPAEAALMQAKLQLRPNDIVLDLACGPGVFTVEWAKRVGPDGLAIGLDISAPMLARAARHVRRWGLTNVLLVRGDAHHLPLAEGNLTKVNCSAGFHQLPDLPRALAEIARVSARGAVLTASTYAEGPRDRWAGLKRWLRARYALHFVPLIWLGEQLEALGYRDYWWSMPGPHFGYASARKAAARDVGQSEETVEEVQRSSPGASRERQHAATR
jgi:ubiquinone/menaquinone biosynthesis C-methylase UbiE